MSFAKGGHFFFFFFFLGGGGGGGQYVNVACGTGTSHRDFSKDLHGNEM